MMTRMSFFSILPFVMALASCAHESGTATQGAPPNVPATETPGDARSSYREQIPDALTEQARKSPIAARDKPLDIGQTAPEFSGRPAGKALVVFYRGHW